MPSLRRGHRRFVLRPMPHSPTALNALCAHNSFDILKSTIPGAGHGLFAKSRIPASDFCCFYDGRFIAEDEMKGTDFWEDVVLVCAAQLSCAIGTPFSL